MVTEVLSGGAVAINAWQSRNNGKYKGDPMENDAELGLHGGNTELDNENDGDVEGESNWTIPVWWKWSNVAALKDKSKLLTQDFVYWCNQTTFKR